MKNLFLLLVAMVFTVSGFAQATTENKTDFRAATGLNVLDNDVFVSLEIGATSGKHSFGAIVESSHPDGLVVGQAKDRQYLVGLKYLHATSIGEVASFVLGASSLIKLDSAHDITFRPETGVQINAFKNLGFYGSIGFPITEGQNGLFNPVRLQAGAQVVLRF
jgi:hypothetical protein